MIVVRDVFQLKFGKAKDALELMKPIRQKMNETGIGKFRLMTDLIGNYYTLVLEGTYESLDEYQKLFSQMQDDEMKTNYSKFTELVINGYRDIWTIVD
ncbi:MAG: hypothetical protein HZB41_02755 [Ignavibacteriae bacterium]|nr:hypothetical protein [Ignavibacteriota bacterium]